MNQEKYAIAFVLDNEGGYANDPNDAGGETKFGISKGAYPHLDIKNLTQDQAYQIYKEDYYLDNNLNYVKDYRVATTLLDFIVNSGRAKIIIQETLNDKFNKNLVVDGIIGPKTINAINSVNGDDFIKAINDARLEYVKSLSSWEHFSRGWTYRINKNYALGVDNGKSMGLFLALGVIAVVLSKSV